MRQKKRKKEKRENFMKPSKTTLLVQPKKLKALAKAKEAKEKERSALVCP